LLKDLKIQKEDNGKLYIEGQAIQWPKEKRKKKQNKERSTKHYTEN
jgi:hypothetical protein